MSLLVIMSSGYYLSANDSRFANLPCLQIDLSQKNAKSTKTSKIVKWSSTALLGAYAIGGSILAVNSNSQSAAFKREAEYLSFKIEVAATYEERQRMREDWNDLVNKSNQSIRKRNIFIISSVAAGLMIVPVQILF